VDDHALFRMGMRQILEREPDFDIIGEAATKISASTRAELNHLPWTDIAGMRHRLIHAYHDIDFDRVWDTVIDDLPPLVESIESLLAENDSE